MSMGPKGQVDTRPVKTLTVAEVLYLLKVLPLTHDLRRAVEDSSVRLVDQLSPEQVDQLRDLCGERLQAAGFDSRYEPNDEGRLLETLVDKLFVG